MLRDLLIKRELFENIRKEALKAEDNPEDNRVEMDLFDKAVLKKLRKKRSLKKYKKKGIVRTDLKEIIEMADITSLELLGGPSNSQMAEEHPEWCNHCGACCTESSPIFIHKDELKPLIMFTPDLESEIIQNKLYPDHFQFKEDRPCKFYNFDAKRCKIYDGRPQVCRNYPLMMIGTEGKARNIINLRYNCNYAVRLVLEKSMMLFDEALRRLEMD